MACKQVSSFSFHDSSSNHWKYDVFLSFRGEDTRKNFTDHLYFALHQRGINAFKDEKDLERGDIISQGLLQAIQHSRITVIIFSFNYSSSTWCLDELAKAYDCMKTSGQILLPVYYGVNPVELRKQTGRCGEAFAKHEQVCRDHLEKVEKWRTALSEVANISGWNVNDRHESEIIQEMVEEILRKLSRSLSSSPRDLVGMDLRVGQLSSCLSVGSDDVRMMGIFGMAGIGKTTLARFVFEELSSQFDRCSFILNVREVHEKHGLVSLQERLLDDTLFARNMKIWDVCQGINMIKQRLWCRKVLIVLDDVDRLTQLESLAGSPDWFGAGSRIIITTRNEHLLLKHGVDDLYKVTGLDHKEALQLLCLKAFHDDRPADGYLELCNHVVNYANGLPLALDVLGSYLRGRSVKEWRSALSRLEESPNSDIMDKLEISFDGLEETEKKIFLDIACFFKGEDKDYITAILESCGFYPDIGISVLTDKSLITITSQNLVLMHDLLQKMGQEIVRRKSPMEPGKRSRLWLYKDVSHALGNNTGTDEVEGIVLGSSMEEVRCFSAKAFQRMTKLRLLKLQNVELSEGPAYLSNELRSLQLYKYPSKSLPSAFEPANLVELILQHSCIQQLWEEKKSLPNLRVIDLSHSQNLIKIADFTGIPNLEKLNLEGCTRLFEIPQSIGVLRRLVLLNLKCCKKLAGLPSGICNVKSLKILNLYGCTKLESLPDNLGNLTCLEEFDVGETGITEVPSSFSLLQDLKVVSFRGCKGPALKPWNFFPFRLLSRHNRNSLPFILPPLTSFRSLKALDISDCNLKDGVIPMDLGCFASLKSLDLSGNDFVSIPASIGLISELEYLFMNDCRRLQSLPDLPKSLQDVNMDGCISMRTIPNICEGSTSKHYLWLRFTNCFKLEQGSNNMGISWLRSYISLSLKGDSQGPFNPEPNQFYMCLPGDEIPRWFSYQSVGTSLKVKLPLGWYNQELLGFAASAVFGLQTTSRGKNLTAAKDDGSEHFTVFCRMVVNSFKPFIKVLNVSKETTRDQLWLLYIPAEVYLTRTEDWWNTSYSQIVLSFSSSELKVKKCGFRMVYRKDIEEEEEIKCRLFNNPNLLLHKRSHDEGYDCDTGGEGTEIGSCDEHLHRKRLKIPVDHNREIQAIDSFNF